MTEQARGTILGRLRAENGKGVVHVEDFYPTDIDDLWSAITDPARLSRWIVDVSGDLRPGGTFTASFRSGWEGVGRVEICEAPRRLVVNTSGEGSDETTMEANLTPEGSGTRLVIEERGLPLEHYADHGAGWQAHIEDLAAYIAGRPTSVWSERWRELTPAYEEIAKTVAAG
jgi:uncharacterized protein YndB with AHSA1/START domain